MTSSTSDHANTDDTDVFGYWTTMLAGDYTCCSILVSIHWCHLWRSWQPLNSSSKSEIFVPSLNDTWHLDQWDLFSQCADGMPLAAMKTIVFKKSLITRWNWDDINHVLRFSMRGNSIPLIGDTPTDTARQEQGFQQGCLCQFWILGSRT